MATRAVQIKAHQATQFPRQSPQENIHIVNINIEIVERLSSDCFLNKGQDRVRKDIIGVHNWSECNSVTDGGY